MRPRPIFVCCENVAVLSECRVNFNSIPNSFATAQMKSPSHAPLSEGVSLSFCRRHCQRTLCSAVSDDCAASKLRDTSRRGPSIHLISRPNTVDHHLQGVGILPGFQLQCPIASAHEIWADALCPLHSHSSGTFLDTELNVWAFSGENINLPTIVRYCLFLTRRALDSDRTQRECTGLQFSKPALDNRLSKSFARSLARNPRSILINSL